MVMETMLRESPFPMLEIAAAQALVMHAARPLGTETIAATAAAGRIPARDIAAPEAVPDVPKSAMDGYALRAADGLALRRVVGELTAGGGQAAQLSAGEAVRIMTGAPMPAGADAMIPVELTEEHDGMLQIARALAVGDHVHPVGADVRRGEILLTAGSEIAAAEVGILASLGVTDIEVYRRPRVAVLATGDEVVEPTAARPLGAVRDSNRYALLAAAAEAGCEVRSLGIARDDRETQRQAILAGLEWADVVLTSGGVSMGTRDLIKPILAEIGTVHFGRVAFKPGKPTTFATVGDRLIFGLPGYPVSSLVSFEVFVRPALRALQGAARPQRPIVQAELTAAVRAADRPEYQRVVVRFTDGRLTATSTGGQGSSRLLSLRGANGLLIVPADGQVYAAGERLPVLLTAALEA
jgi:molybdopterin molybdotransferase